MSDLAPEFKSSAISKRLLWVLMQPCVSYTQALAPQQPSLRSGGHREGWGGTSHRFKKWKLCSKNKRQLLQIKPKFFFLFGTKTKVLYNNTVFDTKTISWNNGWWQRINVFKRTQVIPFLLCKLFSNVWKTETRKYNSTAKSSSTLQFWVHMDAVLLILQSRHTHGILNTRRHTRRHVTKHRLNINMLVPHLKV